MIKIVRLIFRYDKYITKILITKSVALKLLFKLTIRPNFNSLNNDIQHFKFFIIFLNSYKIETI